MSDKFDPKKIIDFKKDYYSILGIDKSDLPTSTNRQNKIEISKIIEQSFRKQARKCHPDFGGSNDQFLDLVRARRILEDPYLKKTYDQGYFEEFNIDLSESKFEVDWNKIGNYRKGTPEDTIGFTLFFLICDLKKDLDLIPAFYPQTEEHNYEWDWVISNTKDKLALSLVNDENEVLRLTDSSQIDNFLPFKIYICIPQTSLSLKRKSDSIINPFGKTLVNGTIEIANYNDYNLLETTDLEYAKKYIKENLINDLIKFKNGELKTETTNQTKWLDTNQINKIDLSQLSAIINMKSYETINDENADEFLNDLNDDESVEKEQNLKPNLPV